MIEIGYNLREVLGLGIIGLVTVAIIYTLFKN